MIYIGASFLAGVCIVLSMMVNSSLEKKAGAFTSIGLNYGIACIWALILALANKPVGNTALYIPWYLFLAGAIGLLTTYLSNRLLWKLPAARVTILRFLGQLFMSALLDGLFLNMFSLGKIWGGLLFLGGIMLNIGIENKQSKILCEE